MRIVLCFGVVPVLLMTASCSNCNQQTEQTSSVVTSKAPIVVESVVPTGSVANRPTMGSAAALTRSLRGIAQVAETGLAIAEGKLSPEDVRKSMRNVVGRMRSCYVKELSANVTLAGVVAFDLQIDEHGVPTDSKLRLEETTLKPLTLASCVSDSARFARFPDLGGAKVTLKYAFAPPPTD